MKKEAIKNESIRNESMENRVVGNQTVGSKITGSQTVVSQIMGNQAVRNQALKLKIEELCVTFSGKRILNRINVGVAKGDFVSILGPSGCGKSTLLKAIAGVLPDYTGDILIDGNNANKLPPHKRKTVIVFQDIRLFPHMNVADNIAFPMKMQHMAKEQVHDKVRELLDMVQLNGFADRSIGKLSGGQQQRVVLARALAAEPEILLLDEPFSGLDENLRFDMKLLLMELHKAYGMTTIMVTHDKEEALSLSDHIVVMEDGCILQSGTPRNVYETPANVKVAKYFGNATFVTGNMSAGIFTTTEFSIKGISKGNLQNQFASRNMCHSQDTASLPDGEYILMIRNDAVTVVEGQDYKCVQVIYTGRECELLIEHVTTGLRIRCCCGKRAVNVNERVSIILDDDKLRFFSIESPLG